MLTIVTTSIMETDYGEEFQFKIMKYGDDVLQKFHILTFCEIARLYQILI